MAKRKKTTRSKPVKVESTRHKDKRTNISAHELQHFVRDDEAAPKTMLYPRSAAPSTRPRPAELRSRSSTTTATRS